MKTDYTTKKRGKRGFTLVELLAAMAVFMIIMTVLLSFLASAQRVWTGCINRNRLYADARTAMNLMARDLQCAFYENEQTPFWNDTASANPKRICFITATPNKPSDADSRLIEAQYMYDSTNYKIQVSYTGDNSSDWNFYGSNASTAFGSSGSSPDGETFQDLIPYVIDFDITCFDNKMNILDSSSTTEKYEFPYAVKIELTLLDAANFTKWRASGNDDLRDNNIRTFTRMIIIGNRGQYD
jgi:prepilin-type N-terminal cleavage/methylation domain-containing protein